MSEIIFGGIVLEVNFIMTNFGESNDLNPEGFETWMGVICLLV